jgi:hypothetical protein
MEPDKTDETPETEPEDMDASEAFDIAGALEDYFGKVNESIEAINKRLDNVISTMVDNGAVVTETEETDDASHEDDPEPEKRLEDMDFKI